MKHHSYSAILAITLAFTPPMAGCAGQTMARTARPAPDDASITTRVKTALLNDPDIRSKIDVDTVSGIVTLSGAVKTAVERDKAMAIARQIGGVSDVKSTLQVP